MTTHYVVKLTEQEYKDLKRLAVFGFTDWCNTWEPFPTNPKVTAYRKAILALKNAEVRKEAEA